MIDYRKKATVPVWTPATGDVRVPAVAGDGPMTAERLAELRGVPAALADEPIATLAESFPGVDDHGGTFRAHLELAALAIALKRRVNVLQAVEHAQDDSGNLFGSFVRVLKRDQRRLDELESGIAGVLVRLSALESARPNGLTVRCGRPGRGGAGCPPGGPWTVRPARS